MSQPLKKQAGHALFWSFLDKGGQQVIQLAFWLVLARLLSKEDFGVISVLTIFTVVASLLQESGFTSALLRKKVVSEQEYCSVFYFNISISICVYLLLFACAPLISSFYDKPILTDVSRFLFLAFVFNGFGIIQNVHLIRDMRFKENASISLFAGIVSGVVAITLAFNGFGVWALAIQAVSVQFIRTILLWIFIKWRPREKFYSSHIKSMASFSSKLLLTGLLSQVCSRIYNNIIAKHFSMAEAGVYDQGYKLNGIPQSIIGEGIKSVAFPVLTKIDDDAHKIKAFRKIIRIAAFISFPVALIIITSAYPLIRIGLTEKWIEAAPILQILAIGGAFYPMYSLTSTILQQKGKSGQLMMIETVRNVILIVSIFICIPFGVIGLVWGIAAVNIIAFVLGYKLIERTTSYQLKEVLTDIFPYMMIALVSYVPIYFVNMLTDNSYILLSVQLIVGSGIYLLITKLLGSKVLEDCINMIRRKNI